MAVIWYNAAVSSTATDFVTFAWRRTKERQDKQILLGSSYLLTHSMEHNPS